MTNSFELSRVLAPELPRKQPLKGITILFVDEDALTTYVMARTLESVGYKTLCAITPDKAVTLCEQEAIDILITEVFMRAMNGFELAERLLERQPHAKVLFASAHSHRTCTLMKPYSPKLLIEAVDTLLKGYLSSTTAGRAVASG